MIEFNKYEDSAVKVDSYLTIPTDVLQDTELSSNDKIIYGLILSRLSLSIKKKVVDEQGRFTCYLTNRQARELTRLSDKTITKAFCKLEENGYITIRQERKEGYKYTNQITVTRMPFFKGGTTKEAHDVTVVEAEF